MGDLLKWAMRFLFTAVLWTFILNIRFENKTLFQRFSEIFVNNELVYEVDSHIDEIWYKIQGIARDVVKSKKAQHNI